jgi:hypothetical protein
MLEKFRRKMRPFPTIRNRNVKRIIEILFHNCILISDLYQIISIMSDKNIPSIPYDMYESPQEVVIIIPLG